MWNSRDERESPAATKVIQPPGATKKKKKKLKQHPLHTKNQQTHGPVSCVCYIFPNSQMGWKSAAN
jgi:hypothetical protein